MVFTFSRWYKDCDDSQKWDYLFLSLLLMNPLCHTCYSPYYSSIVIVFYFLPSPHEEDWILCTDFVSPLMIWITRDGYGRINQATQEKHSLLNRFLHNASRSYRMTLYKNLFWVKHSTAQIRFILLLRCFYLKCIHISHIDKLVQLFEKW